jgi:GAF domain-containing protein
VEPLPQTRDALAQLRAVGDTEAATELLRISREAAEVVPDLVGISLGLQLDQFTFTLVGSSDLALDLDAAQYLDGGPCVAAVDGGDTVATTIDDLLDEDRWLMFARTGAAHGVASTLSLPILRVDRVVAGVNLYASEPAAFDGHHQELASICRAWAPGAVANADLSFSTRFEAVATPDRMRDQNTVDQATGMLAASQHIDTATAATRIREAAARASITETQAARTVIQALSAR